MNKLPFGYDEQVDDWTPHLCRRTSNALTDAGVCTPRALVTKVNDNSFRAIRNLGRKGWGEIERWLSKCGLLERTSVGHLWDVDGVRGWHNLTPRVTPGNALILGVGNSTIETIFAPGTWKRVQRIDAYPPLP